MIGTMIEGEYQVESVIGQGAFGKVYSCSEQSLDGSRRVALKMFNRASGDERELERFIAEGRILASVNHPNVVSIYRLGRHEGLPYMVMEQIEGHSLRELLDSNPPPLQKGLSIMAQVAAGLGAIHAKGIIHRDLSANNIMVATDGTTKVLDLGLARDIRTLSTITQEGHLVGTLAYISPELIEGKPATFASDIFSVGVMLYEITTGRHPFEAEHYMSVMYNIANREPEPIGTFLKDPPPALDRLVRDCLTKRPDKRSIGAEDVERVLGQLLRASEFRSTRLEPVERSSLLRTGTPTNPYLNRAMIRRWKDFFGRTHEIRRIYARLNATPPGSVSIVGDRKIGKSSLLNFIHMRRNRETNLEIPDKMVMVFLDLQQEKNMSMESFVTTLIRMIQLELRGRLELPACEPSLDCVKSVVERLHEEGFRIAILLDEFDLVTANPAFDLEFFAFLRFLANHYNVAYLTSSIMDLQTLCHTEEISDSPFFNIFSALRLSVFTKEEAEELISKPSERADRPLGPHADKILGMTGLFPFYIQIACSHALDYMDEHPDCSEPDFEEVYNRFYREAKLHYRFLWSHLGQHERSAVNRVVLKKKMPDDLRHVLTELEARHLVDLGGEKPRVFAPTFEQFVKEEGSRGGKTPLWKRVFGGG